MTNTTYRGRRVRATHGNGVCADAGREGRSLRANFSWTLAGNVVYAGCQWAILVVLARLGRPETLGLFVLGLTVTAPVLMLTNLQLRAVLATDARREHRFADYVALRAASTLVALLVIGGIALSYSRAACLAILAVAAIKAVESLSDIVHGFLQQRERMDLVGRGLMLRGLLAAAGAAGVFFLCRDLLAAIAAVGAAWLAVLVLYEARCVRRLQAGDCPSFRPSENGTVPFLAGSTEGDSPVFATMLRTVPAKTGTVPSLVFRSLGRLLLTGLPLGFAMMLISLNTNIPRYFLESHWGAGELGIFAALAYVGVAGTQFTSALAQSACPRLARYHAAGATAAFRRLLLRMVAIGAAIGAIGVAIAVLAGRPILALLYGAEYAEQSAAFVLLMSAAAVQCVAGFLGTAITATRGFHRFPLPYLALALAVAACSACWIPAHGLWGAACTAVVAAAGSCIVPLLILVAARKEEAIAPA